MQLADALMAGRLADVVIAALTGFVDFRRRHNRPHAERAPRLRWWSVLVDHVERVGVIGPRLRPTLRRIASTFLRVLSFRRATESGRSPYPVVVVIQPDPRQRGSP